MYWQWQFNIEQAWLTIYNCTKPPQSQERYEEMTNKAKCQKLPPQSQVAYRNREEL